MNTSYGNIFITLKAHIDESHPKSKIKYSVKIQFVLGNQSCGGGSDDQDGSK